MRIRRLVALVVLVATGAACSSTAPTEDLRLNEHGTVTKVLEELTVAPEVASAGYDAAQWEVEQVRNPDPTLPDDGRSCTTRDMFLHQESLGTAQLDDQCKPYCPADQHLTCWTSAYDGRATSNPSQLAVHRRVSAAEAARSPVVGSVLEGDGLVAAEVGWTTPQKRDFYQEWGNLEVATARVVDEKGDQDAGRWRPELESAWCDYASRYAWAKITFNLSVDTAEKRGLGEMLERCPDGYATIPLLRK